MFLKKIVIGIFSVLLFVYSSGAQGLAFTDIDFWVGSGSQQAALVVDWNDGIHPTSIAWGFRWDGVATGEEMLTAIVNADSRLFAKVTLPGSFGVSLIGMGYDLDGDGFSLSDGTLFTDGLAISGGSDTAYALDPDDHYREGWFSAGYWSYWIGSGNPYDGGSWGFSGSGMSDRVLTDGSWDGWSFAAAPTWDGGVPDPFVPAQQEVPEPATVFLMGAGLAAMATRRKAVGI